jgi:hypothetical protein
MSISSGINPGAGFDFPGPLGSGKNQAAQGRGTPHSNSNGGTTDYSHEHHWRLWQPGKKGDLGFFEGSIRQMQSIVMVPGQDKAVRRFGAGHHHYYLDNERVAATNSLTGGRFSLRAGSPGETVLHVENAYGKCRSGLFIHVRRRITLRVHFLVLEDGQKLRAKGYGAGQRKKIIETINDIYLPQLGVEVVDASPDNAATSESSRISIDMSLGDPISFPLLGSATVQGKIIGAIPTAVAHFVPKFIFTRRFNEQGTEGLQKQDRLFIPDGLDSERVGRVCAHELAHLLTNDISDELDPGGHTAIVDHLLNKTGSGVRLDPFAMSLAMYRKSLDVGGS